MPAPKILDLKFFFVKSPLVAKLLEAKELAMDIEYYLENCLQFMLLTSFIGQFVHQVVGEGIRVVDGGYESFQYKSTSEL